MWVETKQGNLVNTYHGANIGVKRIRQHNYSHALRIDMAYSYEQQYVLFWGTKEECERARDILKIEMNMAPTNIVYKFPDDLTSTTKEEAGEEDVPDEVTEMVDRIAGPRRWAGEARTIRNWTDRGDFDF